MTKKSKKRIISWNINGLRAGLKKGLAEFVTTESPDILCLQEIKAKPDQVDLPFTGYHIYFNPAERKGYSGTLLMSRVEPINIRLGLGIDKHDDEGRVITAEFKNCYVVTVYTPNAKRELTRLDYRVNEWDKDFFKYVRKLEKSKPVIFCGDLNVAHKEIDLANPKANKKNAGFTPEERKSFDNIIKHGFIDTFRLFDKSEGKYTWWSNRPGVREKNIGWRIDYFLASGSIEKNIYKADILNEVMGSDHCPITLELDSNLFC